jgi:GDP-4-dehydro-6-deoxy-D-mannose reductase
VRALVTGSEGFAGTRLRESLAADGIQVTGFDIRHGRDVRDYEALRAVMDACEPDLVFHLAAVAWPGESLSDPRRCMDVNVTGTLNVLEAARHSGSHARILLAGTSEEYGYEGREPGAVLDEGAACFPTTPYGASKLAASSLGVAYARRYGLPVVVTRAFNHTGAGRQAVNAESAFARRIVAVERGEADHVPHGDLSSVRDFTDVRDVVAAYRLAVMAVPGVYNVCSERPVTLRQVMGILAGLSSVRGLVLKEDETLVRRDKGVFPLPSAAKLREATGWVPRIPLEDTLAGLLEYWRGR